MQQPSIKINISLMRTRTRRSIDLHKFRIVGTSRMTVQVASRHKIIIAAINRAAVRNGSPIKVIDADHFL